MSSKQPMPVRPWSLYVMCEEGAEATGPFKIGTARVVKYRMAGMKSGNWRNLILLHEIRVPSESDAIALESCIHRALASHRIPTRDWFLGPPSLALSILKDRT